MISNDIYYSCTKCLCVVHYVYHTSTTTYVYRTVYGNTISFGTCIHCPTIILSPNKTKVLDFKPSKEFLSMVNLLYSK